METRFKVINDVLEIEYRLSNLLLVAFRILRDNTYTLSHKSSSLSSKNKIDLLLDLNELNKTEHEQLKTILEIRNQFAHNLNCKTFSDLKIMNKDLARKMGNFFKSDIIEEEEMYLDLFAQLFDSCKKKLYSLQESYIAGLFLEPKKYIALKIIEDMDQIIENAKNLWHEKSGMPVESNYAIKGFILSLQSAIATKNAQLLSFISDKRDMVFDKKSDYNRLIEELKEIDEFMASESSSRNS